jgi:hypothetical protein
MWRIGFAADLFDQFQPRQSQLLQLKGFQRLVVKTVNAVFFARAILYPGEQLLQLRQPRFNAY